MDFQTLVSKCGIVIRVTFSEYELKQTLLRKKYWFIFLPGVSLLQEKVYPDLIIFCNQSVILNKFSKFKHVNKNKKITANLPKI